MTPSPDKVDKPVVTVELEACPFCGKTEPVRRCDNNEDGDDEGNDLAYAVVCDFNLDGCGAASGYHESPHKAEEKWNRRPSPPSASDEADGRKWRALMNCRMRTLGGAKINDPNDPWTYLVLEFWTGHPAPTDQPWLAEHFDKFMAKALASYDAAIAAEGK